MKLGEGTRRATQTPRPSSQALSEEARAAGLPVSPAGTNSRQRGCGPFQRRGPLATSILKEDQAQQEKTGRAIWPDSAGPQTSVCNRHARRKISIENLKGKIQIKFFKH